MNVVISGLAAAGKTTHALLLAKALGFDCISADDPLPARVGFAREASDGSRNGRAKGVASIEKTVNTVTEALQTRDETVFDSWAAPWLPSTAPCVRVWIESTLESRSARMRAAQEPYGPLLALEECMLLVATKDAESARQHQALLGVGFGTDQSVFDVMVNASALAGVHSIDSTRRGIAALHGDLMSGLTARLPAGWRGSMQGGTVHT
jgi:cytidylate kinase